MKENNAFVKDKNIPPCVLSQRVALKIQSKFVEKHPRQNVTSKNLYRNFIEITNQHRSYTANQQHTQNALQYKNPRRTTSEKRIVFMEKNM